MRSWKLAVSTVVVVISGVALAQRGPPPEATAACSGLSAGAACAFTHHGQNLTGTCRSGPGGEALACAPAGGPGPGGGPRTPPAEAVNACQSLASGASCSFTVDGRALNGTCDTPPGGSTLACRPQRPEGEGRRGPPPEALAACASSSAGTSCTVNLHGESRTGVCELPPGGTALACRPEGGMRPHGPPPEAITACASLSEGASCTVDFQGQALIGSCVSGPQGGQLACMPPRP